MVFLFVFIGIGKGDGYVLEREGRGSTSNDEERRLGKEGMVGKSSKMTSLLAKRRAK